MKRIMRAIAAKALVLGIVAVILMSATGKSGATGTSHEIKDDKTIQWIIDQIRTKNSGYASDYVAERVSYLLREDEYRLGIEFPFKDYEASVITDHQTQKDINLRATECYGYARYAYFMLFGTLKGNDLHIDNNVEFSSKGLHAGANIRTNAITTFNENNEKVTFQHSLIFLSRDDSDTGFFCVDANWSKPLDYIIRVEYWSDSEFNKTFYNGVESIREPNLYPRAGDYSVLTDIPYYISPNESTSAGQIMAGTTLHVSKIDSEHINEKIYVKYENQSLNLISFRAIMAQVNSPEGETGWIVFNEPNILQYSGPLTTTEQIVIASGEESSPGFLQSIVNLFKSIREGISGFLSNFKISIVRGAENENQISFASGGNASNGNATSGNATSGNATAGNATAGNSFASDTSQVPCAAGTSESPENTIQSGSFIISLNPNEAEIGDFYKISTESEPYETTTVNGGFLLKCAVCEFVTISYDEYTRMTEGETIQTAAGEIGHAQDISEYEDIGFDVDAPVIFNEGRYFINKIPDANLPELLRDPYQEIWTNAGNEGYPIISGYQQCEYFISDETMVELFDYGNASVTTFGEYMVFGNSEMIRSYTFIATVQNNEIIRLQELYAAIDE